VFVTTGKNIRYQQNLAESTRSTLSVAMRKIQLGYRRGRAGKDRLGQGFPLRSCYVRTFRISDARTEPDADRHPR
jgi:hypothetical protein